MTARAMTTANAKVIPGGSAATNAADSVTREARLDGVMLRGVANLGLRPTIASENPERTLEIHFFDLHREIYGEDVELRFLRFLRPEKKFDSLEDLKTQIAHEAEEARALPNE